MTFTVNYLAVLVATIAGFATGAVWYNVLAKAWTRAVGLTPADMSGTSPLPFIVALVANAVMAWVLAVIATPFVGGGVAVAIQIGAVAWLGFIATTISTNNSFGKKPWSLTLIDSGHWLAVLIVQAVVIGLFGA
jgi:hypothetical protein